jgi:hypothetical protein
MDGEPEKEPHIELWKGTGTGTEREPPRDTAIQHMPTTSPTGSNESIASDLSQGSNTSKNNDIELLVLPQRRKKKKKKKRFLLAPSNFLSSFSMLWVLRLVLLNHRKFDAQNICLQLHPNDQAGTTGSKLSRLWDSELACAYLNFLTQ